MHASCVGCLLPLLSVLALLLLENAFVQALSLPEVLYVNGCTNSNPPRSTSRCFAGPKAVPEVDLSIRGLNFPQPPSNEGAEQFAQFRVELMESLPLSELEGKDPHETVPHFRLSCEDVRQSTVFPTQLLTCVLANPLIVNDGATASAEVAAAAHQAALAQWESVGGSAWFDLVLSVLSADAEGKSSFQEIAVHRRSVQVDLTYTLRKEGRRVMGLIDGNPAKYNISTHPLERLYSAKPKNVTEEAGNESTIPEADDEDYLWVELGIGGLRKELRELFRRVFLSRLPSLANLTQVLDLQHVRGVILYGPPGNGKTLIARSLFKLLGPDTRLTVVNAADVLSKFVGESEKNLRDAFGGSPIGTSSQAETERKDGKSGSLSHEFSDDADELSSSGASNPTKLHVLVIDEFESLFRRRGHSEDESSAKAVYDGVTNTLLSLMDGIENRNDLLVVGLTNRLQTIDSAMLRPGRFEVLIEVPSPDVPAREEIFFIHTAKLREEGFLADDVNLHDLAIRSGGFSGSDIAGTVRSATSYALLRFRQSHADGTTGGRKEDPPACDMANAEMGIPSCEGTKGDGAQNGPTAGQFAVTTEDVNRAMDDIRSAKDETSSLTYLSEQESELSTAVDYDGAMTYRTTAVSALVNQVTRSRRTFTGVVGISGAAGTGKSFLAKQLTTLRPFDTVRYLSCRRLVELQDRSEQLEQVRDALGEASRVRSGLVVLDDFDILLDSLDGYAVYEATLRNMLYEYRNRPRGVSRSLQGTKDSAREASETGGGGIVVNAGSALHDERNRRFLFLTSTRQDALATAEPDLRLRVRAIHRGGLVELLAHYNISSVADAKTWRLAASYPPTISFRNFLRVTDRAVWMSEAEADSAEKPDSTAAATGPASTPVFLFPSKNGKDGARYVLSTELQARKFSESVRSVTAAMSLSDSFTGWYNNLPRTDLYAEFPASGKGSSADERETATEVTSDAETREVDEVAADVGVEALW